MKKLLLISGLAAGVVGLLRKRQNAKADAALWREATSADQRPT